jgi:hypothetical protein
MRTLNRNNIFKHVSGRRPGRSLFDMSYENKFDCDMGEMIPVLLQDCVPGDFIKFGNQAVVRVNPLVAPVLHEVMVNVDYFFVPYRILWDEDGTDNWETFITGGEDGDDTPTHPTWEPTVYTEYSLWDYCGFPVGIDPDGFYPVDWPRRAYNLIYNEWYRQTDIQSEVALTNEAILNCNWPRDYYTSALPWQQRGTAPALPIAGTTSAVWSSSNFTPSSAANALEVDSSSNAHIFAQDVTGTANLKNTLDNNTVDLSVGTTFDIADLRLAFAEQKVLEANARFGSRYAEQVLGRFQTFTGDARLNRPEYIAHTDSPVIFSEVLQTSQTDTTPQGTLAGHGISIASQYAGKYHCKEHGIFVGILTIVPKSLYSQGVERTWIKNTKYDYFVPEFAHISEQVVNRGEIYATATSSENNTVFGYQGAWNEMRCRRNIACGAFNSTLDYWHLGRQFSSAPSLNDTFLSCEPRKDIFAALTVPGFIINFGNSYNMYRPIPILSDPGLLDH